MEVRIHITHITIQVNYEYPLSEKKLFQDSTKSNIQMVIYSVLQQWCWIAIKLGYTFQKTIAVDRNYMQ